jgi:hypothetical protein
MDLYAKVLVSVFSIGRFRLKKPMILLLYPPGQTIINTVFPPHAVVLWNSLPYTVVNAGSLDQFKQLIQCQNI